MGKSKIDSLSTRRSIILHLCWNLYTYNLCCDYSPSSPLVDLFGLNTVSKLTPSFFLLEEKEALQINLAFWSCYLISYNWKQWPLNPFKMRFIHLCKAKLRMHLKSVFNRSIFFGNIFKRIYQMFLYKIPWVRDINISSINIIINYY